MRRCAWVFSVLVLLTACQSSISARLAAPTPTPTVESVGTQWAEAVKVGDTAAMGTLMPAAANNMLFAAWWGRAGDFRKAGRLQAYTIEKVTAAGSSTDILIKWTGSQQPVCTTIQVAPNHTVINVSDFETCKE